MARKTAKKKKDTRPAREIQKLRESYGDPIYPKPRYTIPECLMLLGETRKTFYAKVKRGRYRLRKDGSRSYMLHEDLLDAAKGDAEHDNHAA